MRCPGAQKISLPGNRTTASVWTDLLSRQWLTSHLNADELRMDYKKTLAQSVQGLLATALGRAIWKDTTVSNKNDPSLGTASISWDWANFPDQSVLAHPLNSSVQLKLSGTQFWSIKSWPMLISALANFNIQYAPPTFLTLYHPSPSSPAFFCSFLDLSSSALLSSCAEGLSNQIITKGTVWGMLYSHKGLDSGVRTHSTRQ